MSGGRGSRKQSRKTGKLMAGTPAGRRQGGIGLPVLVLGLVVVLAVVGIVAQAATSFRGRTSPAAPGQIMPLHLTYEGRMPHDRNCFTQGLVYFNGELYESAGLYGESDLRRVNATTGVPEFKRPLEAKYFGEGLTVVEVDGQKEFWQLTWREQTVFVYEATRDFPVVRSFTPPRTVLGELWGICNNGTHFFVTDGSEYLHVWTVEREPREVARYPVFAKDSKGRNVVKRLNEVECLSSHATGSPHTELLLNVWYSDDILRVNAQTGEVIERYDMSKLHKKESRHNVLNGIAYDEKTRKLYITGKNWDSMHTFRI